MGLYMSEFIVIYVVSAMGKGMMYVGLIIFIVTPVISDYYMEDNDKERIYELGTIFLIMSSINITCQIYMMSKVGVNL